MCKAQQLKDKVRETGLENSEVRFGDDCVYLERKGRRTSIKAPLNEITKHIKTPKALLAYVIEHNLLELYRPEIH
jgi:hypothetical protein